jgi:nitrate/TMAO reductase-like tetraheme cytochrome c subunit
MAVAASAVLEILQQAAAARADTASVDSVVVESPLPSGPAAIARFLFNTVPQWIQIAGVFVGAIVAAILLVIIWRRRAKIIAWFAAKSRGWKLGFAALVVLVLSGATFAGVTSWNFMMHDNSFCTGCHVMETPFRKFTASEHSDLSCHDCHKQGMVANVRQLYQWVAERPDRIGSHAPVPNAICADCHIQRDADSTWKRIIATAGHAVHLNPRSPAMRDMQCVTCHGEEVHRFKPAQATCAQSGCHDNLSVQLGKMAGQTSLHCSTCHVFTAPAIETNPTDSAKAALVPNETQCLECHEMREQMKTFKPDNDPHKGVCGSCHNPHTQTTTAGAFQSCAMSGCHARSDTLTAMHRGIRGHKLETCGACHLAHTWKVGKTNCESCHTGISDPAVQVRRRPPGSASAHAPVPVATPVHAVASLTRYHAAPERRDSRQAGAAFGPHPAGRVQRRSSNGEVALAQPSAPDSARFEHARHRSVRCLTCHTTTETHGALKASARACSACHHANTVAGNTCETCHQRSEITGAHSITTAVALSVWPAARTRTLTFTHDQHTTLACADCHGSDLHRTVAKTCTSCHTDHHAATRSCASCHSSVRDTHTRALHLTGCAGSGCHTRENTAAVTPARSVCLACHVEQKDHKPGRECAPCHLSTWRPSAAPASP